MFGTKVKNNPSEASKYLCHQDFDWDCWLRVVETYLKYTELPASFHSLLTMSNKLNFKISEDYGGFFPYIPLLLNEYGFNTKLFIPLYRLPEIQDTYLDINEISEIYKNLQQQNSARAYLYSALEKVMNTDICKCQVLPNRKKMHKILQNVIRQRNPFIVQVDDEKYYNIECDGSNHMLLLLPCEGKQYNLLDTYVKRGNKMIPNWQKHYGKSLGYNWLDWNDWLLVIEPQNAF